MPLSKNFSPNAAPDAGNGGERPVILVVDDEEAILMSLEFLLQRTYRVLTADNGEQALELLKDHDVSVILSDQRMPKITGVELLAQAFMVSPDTVRIMITGHADIEDVIQAVNRGKIFSYVAKPWNPPDLMATISNAVNHNQLLRERRALIAKLQATNAELQQVNVELEQHMEQRTRDLQRRTQQLKVQEAEQRYLARELHDEIGQALITVKWSLETIQQRSALKPYADYLKDSLRTVEDVLRRVSNLSFELRPSLLDELGLIPALNEYARHQFQQTGVAVRVKADLPAEPGLPPILETACFRIVQAALANVIQHAQAHQAHIELRQDDKELQLIIRDDGIGFDVQAARDLALGGESLGLLNIEERVLLVGGQLTINSAPNQGTEIHVRLPLTSAVCERNDDFNSSTRYRI